MRHACQRVLYEKSFISIGTHVSIVVQWLNVLNVRRKSALPRKLGKWLEEKTRAVREQSSRLGSFNAVENHSDPF